MSNEEIINLYVWSIKHIAGFTIDNVPPQRRAEVEAKLSEGGDL